MTYARIIAIALCTTPLSALADDAKADLVGSYSYTRTFTAKLTAPAVTTLHDTETGELSVGGSSKSDLLFTWSSKGAVCHLHAKRVGANAVKFMKGEACNQEDDAAKSDLTITLVTGSGTMIDDELTLNLTWKLSGTVEGHAVSGSATETTSCEKH